MMGHADLADSIRGSAPAVVPYLTAGYPDMATFGKHLEGLMAISPAVEVGIPFSDPMADGATIQASSQASLQAGTTLHGVLDVIEEVSSHQSTPLVVMTYLNPLLAYGLGRVMGRLSAAGVAALVIPDLPYEESDFVTSEAAPQTLGLVQLVTPLSDPDRLAHLCKVSQGFVYAVTMTGTTGGAVGDLDNVGAYLARVKKSADAPVLAGFGIRSREQVRHLAGFSDGVIVGSATIEAISRGDDPVRFIEGLRP